MEWIIAILIVAAALWLVFFRPAWLLDYAIAVLAFNRGLRRIVDYYFNGAFNPLSPISLTPLLVAGLLAIPALTHLRRLKGEARSPFVMLALAIGLGFAVGIVLNRFQAVYSLAEWIAALAAMAFAATFPANSQTADRWIKSAGWAALGVAGYGWWQYFTIPPWDAMWLVQSGMVGYMGLPEPTQMTVFSTLNERGPCGTFMAWAVIPMILNSRWRNAGGWISVGILLATIFLTGTRSNFVIIAVVSIVYPALSGGRGLLGLVVTSAIVVLGLSYGIEKIPGSDRFAERFRADSFYGEDSSLTGRLEIYQRGLPWVAATPLGLGLGSSGMAGRVESHETSGMGDCGYVQIFSQFGWLGGFLFYAALWRVWKELSLRWKVSSALFGAGNVDPFVIAARALLIGAFVFLFVGDIFAGFSLVWVILGRSMNPRADSIPFIRQRLHARDLGKHASPLGEPVTSS